MTNLLLEQFSFKTKSNIQDLHYISYYFPALSLESEWQQVSSDFQHSSEYSSRSQHCWGLYDLDSSSDFQFHKSYFSKPMEVVPGVPDIIGITATFMFTAFSALWHGLSMCLSFLVLSFSLIGPQERQNLQMLLLLILFEFFPPALADGLSLEFEWQQVSSSLQNSSQYSSRSQ